MATKRRKTHDDTFLFSENNNNNNFKSLLDQLANKQSALIYKAAHKCEQLVSAYISIGAPEI